MSVGAITAGEAYVFVTCDNSELVAGLNESSDAIRSTAQEIASMEDALTARVGVEGVGALESALTRIEGAVKRTGTETVAAFAIAAEARICRRWREESIAPPSGTLLILSSRIFQVNRFTCPRR